MRDEKLVACFPVLIVDVTQKVSQDLGGKLAFGVGGLS
jgi:hypothetical protein